MSKTCLLLYLGKAVPNEYKCYFDLYTLFTIKRKALKQRSSATVHWKDEYLT